MLMGLSVHTISKEAVFLSPYHFHRHHLDESVDRSNGRPKTKTNRNKYKIRNKTPQKYI